ncbi:DegT/DnrJ/EryC1/StrS aminotransferase family protein [Azospirillaceae bacterium]
MGLTMTSNTQKHTPVPAAKVDFSAEDRQWIADRIKDVLADGHITLGKYGTEFEEKFSAFCKAKHAIAVNSGTSALEIILRTLNIEGKDVLVPANTFFATIAAVIHAGGRPIFTDTDPASFGSSPEEIERRLTSKTAAVIVVHIGGIVSARMPEIQALCNRKGVALVEDAAHAHGSSLDGVMAGSFGIASSFSFYPTKLMTSGEGGMIVTNDNYIAKEARSYRDQGKESFSNNIHTRMGYNWRMSEPHAIIGLRHLERLPSMIAARQRIAALYDEAMRGYDLPTPLPIPKGGICNFYKYIAIFREVIDRKALKLKLRDDYNVSLSGEVYEEPIHKQPIFQAYQTVSLPVSEDICARHICLPLFSSMTNDQAQQVIAAIRNTLTGV